MLAASLYYKKFSRKERNIRWKNVFLNRVILASVFIKLYVKNKEYSNVLLSL